MNNNSIIDRDLAHLWHPCTQMKIHEAYPPIQIKKAEGSYFYTEKGQPIIDAISSWWCKSLGHAHPVIKAAVQKQMEQFEHIILAGTTNENIVKLTEKLASLIKPLDRVFYCDNGSTGVEIAIKMALQYQAQTGKKERTEFIALQNGYHGETVLTLAAGDLGLYSAPYQTLMQTINKLRGFGYVVGKEDPGWNKINDNEWSQIEAQLEECKNKLAGIIFEPILQGAGGMQFYSPDLLRRLRKWADKNEVLLIADEILTGMGRLGYNLACETAGIVPDFAVLSKGLTAGWIPMAAILTSTKIYNAFYADFFSYKGFLHSNTYTGNALAVAAALAAFKVYEKENIYKRVRDDAPFLKGLMQKVVQETGCMLNVRGEGFVTAADIINPETGKSFVKEKLVGFKVYQEAVKRGAWLRPLGDTVYFLPPLNTSKNVLEKMAEIAAASIKFVVDKELQGDC